ncbi:FdhF/YdeP family oxidoreductase [Uruburuella testudinis]|uniref:FdhF/YdeP family oxidoreductase n=1 Tax=Uruburuella testudinis TaxID=1282863 RepID=A0ABY4DTF8_9NEIS|nr:FdhF/YdeP family oxidoreductase [Uruburuella testudinis]UOO81975.1 FdhF/YdeP family oxidoreductase [Uruburuella testudinis]
MAHSKIHHGHYPAGGWLAAKALGDAFHEQMNMREEIKIMFEMNKPGGFDCPGCAWPDANPPHPVEMCENGGKAMSWEATSKRTTPEFFAKHTVGELLGWCDYDLENEGRLTHPMKYDAVSDTYQAVEWDTAFAEVGALLQSYAPETVEFYTSGRTSNEAAFLYQLFGREYGHNNFPDCSNMCHEPTSVGLPPAIGVGKATITLDDLAECDLLISIGHNPGTNHPRMLTYLREISRRGAKIVAINPLKERGLIDFIPPQSPMQMVDFQPTKLASDYYTVRVGGDAALLKGVMRCVIEAHEAALAAGQPAVLDEAFIAEHTSGYEALRADVLAVPWDKIEQVSGLARSQIEAIARLYIEAERTIICYGMGATQHESGTQNIQQMVNLLLLKGNIGRPGTGISPVRGHSNVQGDRTVGITEKPNAALIGNLEKRYGFDVPKTWGHAAVASMQAIAEGRAKALICMGGNLVMAMPDQSRCIPGVKSLDLAVHIGTKLNRSHLTISKNTYLFPVLGRTEIDRQAGGEQAVTVEDSMSMVHASWGKLEPASPHLKSECAVVAGMAKATLPDSKVDWDKLIGNYDLIRDDIEFVFPEFAGFNEKIRRPGGFHLRNAAAEREWNTPNGKANFLVMDGINEDPRAGDSSRFSLTTLRSHDQYNTTVYGLDDRYRGVYGMRNVLFINAAEAAGLGVAEGDKVNIEALDKAGRPTGRRLDGLVVVVIEMADRAAATYFPEANDLVDLENFDKASGIPAYKNVPIRIEKAPA